MLRSSYLRTIKLCTTCHDACCTNMSLQNSGARRTTQAVTSASAARPDAYDHRAQPGTLKPAQTGCVA